MPDRACASPTKRHDDSAERGPDRRVVIAALGVIQILAWGSTFYLLAVLATPIARDTGWPYQWVFVGVSLGLLIAGAVSPRVGRAIDQRGGRPVLALGAILMAAGLCLLGAAPNLLWYLAAWVVLGAGMGAGLYDAAFSALGRIYGQDSRGAITAVTLFGGFASTVCWPLTAFLLEHAGWRGACFFYAAVHLGFSLPIYLLALPSHSLQAAASTADLQEGGTLRLPRGQHSAFWLLAAVVTLAAAILSLMGTQLLELLQARGAALSTAVAFGMLIGPSAVGARFVEMLAGRNYHPMWTLVASVVGVELGALLLLSGLPLVAPAIILYAAGNGIGSIARGTVPLALFGATTYPVLMGRLALPILIAMAVSPYLGAWAFELGGANWTLALLAAMASLNMVLVGALWRVTRNLRRASAGP